MRRESITCGGIPIAVRHIESIMRMSEARYVIRRGETSREMLKEMPRHHSVFTTLCLPPYKLYVVVWFVCI